MKNEKQNKNFNHDLNNLFERLLVTKNKRLKNVEELKRRITTKLDLEIKRLYAKKNFIFDRHLLPYLNWFEKFNCFYCSYFNCLISYVKEISARTERYWCPIKHSRPLKDEHSQYDKFVDYSDGEVLRKQWNRIRKF